MLPLDRFIQLLILIRSNLAGTTVYILSLMVLMPATGYTQSPPNPPVLSLTGGFYDEPITISIFTSAPNLTILYTLDGSEPHPDHLDSPTYRIKTGYQRHPASPEGSFVTDSLTTFIYTEPLFLHDATSPPNRYSRVNTTWDERAVYAPFLPNPKAIVLRVRTMSASGDLSRIVTQTYFIRSQPERFTHRLPVVSVTMSPDHLFSYDEGFYVPGAVFDQWRADNPGVSAHAFSAANYTQRGEETERPGSLEYFVDTRRVFAQDIGFRIHGGATRSFPQKSLRLYARNRYSTSSMNHPFFGTEEDRQFRRLILRNNGDDFLRGLLRDRYHHRVFSTMGIEYQLDQPVVVYMNGEYWGIKALRERIDRHYLDRRFELNGAPVDILANNMLIEEGSSQHYQQMMQVLADSNPYDPAMLDVLGAYMDIDNYIRYLTAQMYVVNTDWPHNNIRYWRTSSFISDQPGRDGRWRWLFFDTDIGSLSTRFEIDMVAHLLNADESLEWSRLLPRALMKQEPFRHELLNRVAEELNFRLHPDNLLPLLSDMREELVDEVDAHIARWRRPVSRVAWEASIHEIETFARERPAYLRRHLTEHFSLPGETELRVVQSRQPDGAVRVHTAWINGMETPEWMGVYFRGVPLQIEAVPAEGYRFAAWKPPFEDQPALFTLTPDHAELTLEPVFILGSHIEDDTEQGRYPHQVYLIANAPNPFNPTTRLTVEVNGMPAAAKLRIYDTLGREVATLADTILPAGSHHFVFDAQQLSSGIYIAVLEADGIRQSRSMLLMR